MRKQEEVSHVKETEQNCINKILQKYSNPYAIFFYSPHPLITVTYTNEDSFLTYTE